MRKSALFAFGLVVTALVALGLVILSSASEANALKYHHDAYFFMKRQFMYLGAGVLLASGLALLDYRMWKEYRILAWLFYGGVFLALFAVFPMLGGKAINGSFRWIRLGPVNVQPSEFAKLAIVIVLAVWLDRAAWRVELFVRGALLPFAFIGVLAVPILFETDLGSTMVLGAAGCLLMFVAGTRISHLTLFAGLGGMAFLARMVMDGNRMRRLAAWLPSWAASFCGVEQSAAAKVAKAVVNTENMDPAAYQAHMALVAIKNGGLFGVGLGESIQKHYYLPEAHTDFIFAIGAEELGLFRFTIWVVLLYVAFFALSVYIAKNASDRFGRLLVIGMAFIVFFQAMFNLGVVCEALPTKGMALPFFSYGGTNLLSSFFAIGTILSVGIHSYRDSKRKIKFGVFV